MENHWRDQQPWLEAKPRLRGDIEIRIRGKVGRAPVGLFVPARGTAPPRALQIGLGEAALLAQLDGQRTIDQARLIVLQQWPEQGLTEPEVERCVRWACREGVLDGERPSFAGRQETSVSRRRHALTWLQIPLLQGGPWLDPLTAACGWIFRPVVACAAALLGGLAILIVVANHEAWLRDVRLILTPWGWCQLAIIWVGLKVLHELGHAIASRRFGAEVGEMGIAWVLVAPVAFVDLTDSYRIASKWQRMAVALGGVYVEATLAALAVLFWNLSEVPAAQRFWVTVATSAGVSSLLFNLNPLMRFDGYFALTDFLEHPNLARDAQAAFRRVARWILFGDRSADTPQGFGLSAYGAAIALYRLAVLGGLCLAAAKLYGMVGLAIATLLVAGIAAKWLNQAVGAVRAYARQRPSALVRAAWVSAACGVPIVVISACMPAWTDGYPAVIEYTDDSPIRVRTAGFVTEVTAHEGQQVKAGEVLLVLENHPLRARLEVARVQWEAERARERLSRQTQQAALAKSQRDGAAALESRVEALERELDALTIRAPRAGTFCLATAKRDLRGRWLTAGTPLGLIVQPAARKIIAAIPQSKFADFKARFGKSLQVQIDDQCIDVVPFRVGQSGRRIPPHPAMPATAGGPIACQVSSDQEPELTEPHVAVECRLPANAVDRPSGYPATLLHPESDH